MTTKPNYELTEAYFLANMPEKKYFLHTHTKTMFIGTENQLNELFSGGSGFYVSNSECQHLLEAFSEIRVIDFTS